MCGRGAGWLAGVYSLDQHGGDGLAGTAPGGEAVEQDDLVVGEGGLPLLGTRW